MRPIHCQCPFREFDTSFPAAPCEGRHPEYRHLRPTTLSPFRTNPTTSPIATNPPMPHETVIKTTSTAEIAAFPIGRRAAFSNA